MDKINVLLLTISILLLWVNQGNSLECYACQNQDSNKDKCIKTSVQCEGHMDMCMTEVKWGLPPYWVPYGERQHYVTKYCATSEHCLKERKRHLPYCKRDWYDDWKCVECCHGDLCNYYVTLKGNQNQAVTVTLLLSLISSFTITRFYF
ncbi:DgyrCDS170 [Dimorphilus gyrociliatus]|uniref:DgyrCDS170 n=1 Tax=Dimorphilus gyrociliatus TaxID=2664684 RepID=A0A7I8V6K0_9ANNE|nr:DgyrCDS170 [Dimorphilus gyrociliatus]